MSYHFLAESFKSELLQCQHLPDNDSDKFDQAFWVSTPEDTELMNMLQISDKWQMIVKVTDLDRTWKYKVQCPAEYYTLVQAKCYEYFIPKILKSDRYAKIKIVEDDPGYPVEELDINGIKCHLDISMVELMKYIVEKYAQKDIKTQIQAEARRIAMDMLPEEYAQIPAMVEAVTHKIVQQATKFTEDQEYDFKSSLSLATGLVEEFVGKIDPIIFEAKNYF